MSILIPRAGFITASSQWSIESISKVMSKLFKKSVKQISCFHQKSTVLQKLQQVLRSLKFLPSN